MDVTNAVRMARRPLAPLLDKQHIFWFVPQRCDDSNGAAANDHDIWQNPRIEQVPRVCSHFSALAWCTHLLGRSSSQIPVSEFSGAGSIEWKSLPESESNCQWENVSSRAVPGAVFGTAFGERADRRRFLLGQEWQDPVVERIGSGNTCLYRGQDGSGPLGLRIV